MLEENLKINYILDEGIRKSYLKKVTENISASEKIKCDINKEHDPFKMLDLSLLCISIMTGESEFYNQNFIIRIKTS